MTSFRMARKFMFSARESVVGGSWVVVPMARLSVGGLVGRKERMWELLLGLGKTCYGVVSRCKSHGSRRVKVEGIPYDMRIGL